MKSYGETEPTAFARADAYVRRHRCMAGVLFLLLGDVIQGATKAGGISSRKKMLRRGRVCFSRPAHCLWDRKIRADRTVVRFSMTVPSASRGCRRGEERLDGVHGSGSHSAALSELKGKQAHALRASNLRIAKTLGLSFGPSLSASPSASTRGAAVAMNP